MATPGMGERPNVRGEIPGFHQDVNHRGTICETELLNPFSAVGFGPRLRGLGSRPVSAASRSRKAGDPSGRPIVSAPRNAAIASEEAGASIRSPNRRLDRSSIGATITRPS